MELRGRDLRRSASLTIAETFSADRGYAEAVRQQSTDRPWAGVESRWGVEGCWYRSTAHPTRSRLATLAAGVCLHPELEAKGLRAVIEAVIAGERERID
jgi:hypothetical protein